MFPYVAVITLSSMVLRREDWKSVRDVDDYLVRSQHIPHCSLGTTTACDVLAGAHRSVKHVAMSIPCHTSNEVIRKASIAAEVAVLLLPPFIPRLISLLSDQYYRSNGRVGDWPFV